MIETTTPNSDVAMLEASMGTPSPDTENPSQEQQDSDEYHRGDGKSDTTDNRKPSVFTDKETIYIDTIKECCIECDGLDIFQLMAINTDKTIKSRAEGVWSALKAFLCAATQICGIFFLLWDYIGEGIQEKASRVDRYVEGETPLSEVTCPYLFADDYEPPTDTVWLQFRLRLLSFLFSAFLALVSIDHLNHVEKGLYKNLAYGMNLKWVNSLWLRFGLSINIVVSVVAVYGSFLVVFFSTNSLDMILNSVALFFIVELDDLLVRKRDYIKILHYVEQAEYKNARELDEEPGCCQRCITKLSFCIGCIYTMPFQIIKYITIGFCFLVPFIVAICY